MGITEVLKDRRNEVPFLVLISFLISFTIARLYVLIIGSRGNAGNLIPLGKYTLHHFYYGVALLIIAGWMAINYKNRDIQRLSSLIYGAGLGIFFDEIGLILTEFGDYWDGITYTVIVIIGVFLLNIIFFSDFWEEVSSDLYKFGKKHSIGSGPLSLMGLIDFLGTTDQRIPNTSRVTVIFSGLILVSAGLLILRYPRLMVYWVSAAFILSGLAYIIRGIRS